MVNPYYIKFWFSDLLAAISFSTRLAVVKVKRHSTSGELQAEGNDLAYMAAGWAAQESSTSPYCSVASGANFRSTLGGHKYFVQMCSTKKQAITLLQSPAFRILGSEQ